MANIRRNNCSQKAVVDTSIKKWYIIVVAGQSNAVGYDESEIDEKEFPINPRICQLGYKGDNNLKIIPLRWCAENFQDVSALGKGKKGCKGIHYYLAQKCLTWLPSDYGVLIIPAAFGGTSIIFKVSGWWGPSRANFNEAQCKTTNTDINSFHWQCLSAAEDTPLDNIQATNPIKTIQYRLKRVLVDYPGSALLGIVWVQGESTTFNTNQRPSGISNDQQALYSYTRMFQGIKSVLYLSGIKNFAGQDITHADIYTFRAPAYWGRDASVWLYDKIQELYKKMLPAVNYILPPQTDSVTNKYNGAPSGQGQTSSAVESHYGNNAFRDYIAPAIAEAMHKRFLQLNGKYNTIQNQAELVTAYKVG